MDLGIEGKVAMISGGSRGLGKHAAQSLAREGCKISICARGAETLEETVAELSGLGYQVHGTQADVTTDENGVVTMAQGGIDIPSLPVSVEEVVQERANARAQLLLGETVYQPDESVPDRADGIISPFKPASPGRETGKAYFLVPVHYDANGVLVVGMGFCEASTDQLLDEAAAFFAQEAER